MQLLPDIHKSFQLTLETFYKFLSAFIIGIRRSDLQKLGELIRN